MSSTSFIHTPLKFSQLPQPIYHLLRSMLEETIYPPHHHPWGEFVYSFSGVVELTADNTDFRVPPNFGLWLPLNTEHNGGNHLASDHCSLYIDSDLAATRGMPTTSCALMVNPMLRAMLNHLRLHPPKTPYSAEENRLLDVVLDQLVVTPSAGSYLPDSDNPMLIKVLTYLKENPGSQHSIKHLAERCNCSERTLARKAQRDLGMPLSEWRQRLKIVRAIPMLQEGATVENVALDLGYSTASAFIAMFKRLLGTTPDEYRKNSY